MPTTRAKFVCERITDYRHGNREVVLNPVTGDSEENKSFWKYTPSGEIKLTLSKDCSAQFEIGTVYYIDFTPVNDTNLPG